MSGTPDHTGKTGGGGSSRLSVDAAVFVPGLRSPTGSQAREPFTPVPRYLTTCYPFVSPGTQPRHKPTADDEAFDLPEDFAQDFDDYTSGGFDPTSAAAHASHYVPHLGYEPSTSHAWISSSMPFGPTNLASFTPGVHIPFDGGTLGVVAGGQGLLPSPQKMGTGDGLLPTPPYPPLPGSVLNPLPAPAMASLVPPFQLHPARTQGRRELNVNSAVFVPSVSRESSPRKSSPRKSFPASSVNSVWDWEVPLNPGSVSRGTQKEVVNISTTVRRHTIIMRDATVQTDFNLDLAELTLQEKPSLLYRRGQRRTNWSLLLHNSTDSEEVDSDSGYSSPMHRRNLVSNGTHPVRIGVLAELGHAQPRWATQEEKRAPVSAVVISVGSCSSTPSTTPLDTPCTTPVVTPTASSTSLASSGGSLHKPQGIAQAFPAPGAVTLETDAKLTSPGVPRARSKQRERSKSKDSLKSGDESQGKVKVATAGDGEAAATALQTPVKMDWTAPPVKTDWTAPPVKTDWTAPPNSMEFPTLKPAKRNEPPWSLTPVTSSRRGDQTGGCLGTVMDSVKSYASIVKSLSSQPLDSAEPVPAHVVQNCNNSCADDEVDKLDKGKKGSVVVQHQAEQSGSSEGAQGRASHAAGAVVGSAGARARSRVGAGRPDNISAVASPDKEVSTGVPAQRAMPISGPGPRAWREAVYSKPGILGPAPVPLAWGPVGCGYRPPSLPHPAFLQGVPVLTASVDPVRKQPPGQGVRDVARAHYVSSALPAASGTVLLEASKRSVSIPRAADSSGSTPSAAAEKDDSPVQRHRSSSQRSSSGGREHHRSRSKSGNVTDSTHPASVGSDGEEEEGEGNKTGEGEEGAVVKKRRRRRRRRRRGRASTEGEGQSDGMSGMEHAASSSNISRTSDVTLHFEDDQEFPDIGTACALDGHGGGVLGQREESTLASRLGGEKDIGLGGAVPAGILAFRRSDSTSSLTYSDILRRKPSLTGVRNRTQSAPGSCLSGEEGGEEDFNSQPGERWAGQTTASSKRAQKRRKRRELANRAAEAELAEITLEQQMLRELGTKAVGQGLRPGSSGAREDRAKSREANNKSPARGLITDPQVVKQCKATPAAGGGGGRRLHTPIALNIADMLDAFEKKKTLDQKAQAPAVVKKPGPKEDRKSANPLDASAPVKRGKEREAPKPKKPSPLKKVILKEREEKKRMRLIGDCEYDGVDLPVDPGAEDHTEDFDNNLEGSNAGNPICVGGESDLSQDGLSSRSIDTDQGVSPGADLSPISQTSPMSMSPLTPGASPLNSPIAGFLSRDPVVLRIHSRRFREYCTQILDKEIDTCATALLHELVRFQDRMYHKDPTKAKGKRRVVLGLREVAKHLKLKKIKCVIISPNLEKIQSKGGLDEALNNILNMCQEQNVPFVFALGRRALGRACAKLVPVSVAGIFNYEGCEEKFNDLISLTHKGREAYAEMVRAVEREINENPTPPSLSGVTSTSFPSVYAHMGHSRTPSGCSAISFTSSVLSEPISENYPHAEPETDSKGYEIVRDDISDMKASAVQSFCQPSDAGGGLFSISRAATAAPSSHNPFPEDSDDGNEADTEDIIEGPLLQQQQRKRVASPSKRGSVAEDWKVEAAREGAESIAGSILGAGQPEPAVIVAEDAGAEGKGRSRGLGMEGENVGAGAMPHIDSIHCLSYELPSDLLSQHSSSQRTLDLEALSTHSSHTLGDGGGGLGTTHTPDSPPRLGSKDRVQSWLEKNSLAAVDEAQSAEVEEMGVDSMEKEGSSLDGLVNEGHFAPCRDKLPGQYSPPKSKYQEPHATTNEGLVCSRSEDIMALGNHLDSVPDLSSILKVAAVKNHCLSRDVGCLLSSNVTVHSLCVNDHEHACLETNDRTGHAQTVDADVIFVKDLCVASEDDSSKVNGDFVNIHSFSVLCGAKSELCEAVDTLPELQQSQNINLIEYETSIQPEPSADS